MIGRGGFSRPFWIVGVALFVSYAYFYQAGGWNQNSRFALVRAMVEKQTLRIDAYQDATQDRAISGGHYYSDKAPGASFLALIPVDIARAVSVMAGVAPDSPPGIAWLSYVATVFTSALFTIAAALCVMWLALFLGYSRGAAIFAATAYGVATPAWAYATLFQGHGVTAGCLMIAFSAAVAMARWTAPARIHRLAWIAGVFCGWAVLSEFPAAVPMIFIVSLALATAYRADKSSIAGVALRIVAGGAIAAVLLMAYDTAAFGSPFHVGYASEEGFEELHKGLFGITYPQWWRVQALFVGRYRGLLPIAPLMALTPFGLIALARSRDSARPALVAAAIAVFYLLLNASYFYWEGGWAFGPRQMTPALPFLALGLAPLWDHWPRIARAALVGGWIWGASLTLAAVATTPQPPADYQHPVTELFLPYLRAGELALNTQRFIDLRPDSNIQADGTVPKASWNLGMKMGLTGKASLAPLAAIWICCLLWFIAGERERARTMAAAASAAASRAPGASA